MFIIEPITDSVLVTTCIEWKSTLSALLKSAVIPFPCHSHCECDAAKVKAVTITAEQRTWLKVVEQTHQNLVANFYGPIPTKLFVNIILVMIM